MKTIEPNPHGVYPIGAVIKMTGSSHRKIRFYCRKGVIKPKADNDDEWEFDEEMVIRLRRIETFRQVHRMNWAAIQMIVDLMREVEALEAELRFRR